jgi:hypothetical protein
MAAERNEPYVPITTRSEIAHQAKRGRAVGEKSGASGWVAALNRRREPEALEPMKRDAGGLKIISAQSGPRQHLGGADASRSGCPAI